MEFIKTTLSKFDKPPTTQDPQSFNERADKFLEHLPIFKDEINQVISEINTFSSNANKELKELSVYIEQNINQIEERTNNGKLALLKYAKDLEKTLKIHAQNITDECLTIVENKGYEMIERLNDNGVGADYIAISQSLAHSLSLERFIMEKGFIKFRKEEVLNLDDVNLSLEEQRRDIKLSTKALENITNILSSQNEINLTLKGKNNA